MPCAAATQFNEGDEGGVGQEASSESRNAMAVAISLTQATAQAE
jgi:hypothetical protein